MAGPVSGVIRRLLGTNLRRSAAGSILTGFVAQGFLIVSGVLTARILGVEGRGYLALIVLFPLILVQFGSFGLPQAVTHFVSRDRSHARSIISRARPVAVMQVVCLTSVLAVLYLIYTWGKPGEIALSACVSLPVILGGLAQQYGMAVLLGIGDYRAFNIWRAAPAVIYATLVVLSFTLGIGGLVAIAASWTVAVLVAGFSVLYVASKRAGVWPRTDPAVTVPSMRQMLSFGAKGMLGYVSPLDNFHLDHIVAGLLLSPSALGLYVVGQAFVNLPRFLAQGVGLIVFPVVSRLAPGKAAKRAIRRSVLAVVALNSALIIPLIILMPSLMRLFFGEAFASSVPIARILLVGSLFLSARRTLAEGHRGLGRPQVSTYAELIVYPALAISVPMLIAWYGIAGLAWAVLVGQVVSLLYALAVGLETKEARLTSEGRS